MFWSLSRQTRTVYSEMARLQADYCPTRSPMERIHVKGQDYFYYSDKDEKVYVAWYLPHFLGLEPVGPEPGKSPGI